MSGMVAAKRRGRAAGSCSGILVFAAGTRVIV
jgi:hypothetical protein